jgi:hypothetical protein
MSYFGLKAFGQFVAVRILEDIDKVGKIVIPTGRRSLEFKSCVGRIVAKGEGGSFNTKEVDHWFPGSKKWGKTKIEKPQKEPNKMHTGDFNVGDYVLFMHPYVSADFCKLIVSSDEYRKYRERDQHGSNTVSVFFVSFNEIICILELEDKETEYDLRKIAMGRVSV